MRPSANLRNIPPLAFEILTGFDNWLLPQFLVQFIFARLCLENVCLLGLKANQDTKMLLSSSGFIPALPIFLAITKTERSSSHRFNPYLYTIEMQHGPYQWVVRRRYQHFRRVHTSLFVFRTGLKLRREANKASITVSSSITNLCISANQAKSKILSVKT